jgi:aspartate ammonia-lyase
VLKRVAVKLPKTYNGLCVLSSGPCAGLGEISLPAMQAGSNIMPARVNPVIPEIVNQIAFGVIKLNAFEPIIQQYNGYTNATQVAQEALMSDRVLPKLVLEKKRLSKRPLEKILQPEMLSKPRPTLEAQE